MDIEKHIERFKAGWLPSFLAWFLWFLFFLGLPLTEFLSGKMRGVSTEYIVSRLPEGVAYSLAIVPSFLIMSYFVGYVFYLASKKKATYAYNFIIFLPFLAAGLASTIGCYTINFLVLSLRLDPVRCGEGFFGLGAFAFVIWIFVSIVIAVKVRKMIRTTSEIT